MTAKELIEELQKMPPDAIVRRKEEYIWLTTHYDEVVDVEYQEDLDEVYIR